MFKRWLRSCFCNKCRQVQNRRSFRLPPLFWKFFTVLSKWCEQISRPTFGQSCSWVEIDFVKQGLPGSMGINWLWMWCKLEVLAMQAFSTSSFSCWPPPSAFHPSSCEEPMQWKGKTGVEVMTAISDLPVWPLKSPHRLHPPHWLMNWLWMWCKLEVLAMQVFSTSSFSCWPPPSAFHPSSCEEPMQWKGKTGVEVIYIYIYKYMPTYLDMTMQW